jgi:hypothetical protein
MKLESEREYASQADYSEWVREAAEKRVTEVTASLRKAFSDVIHKEEIKIIVFSDLTSQELAERFMKHHLILKPLLAASNIAARAIERDLGINNLDTYRPRLSSKEALAIASYIKPFLPDSLPIPALAAIDRAMFADKEIRKIKGQWERMVTQAINSHANAVFKKSQFQRADEPYEIDAATKDSLGNITYAVDIKRIEARRDIHKRTDEIINKATQFKAVFPSAKFGAVIYYPFLAEHGNVRDRLQSPNIDSVVFAGASAESIGRAVKLLLGKFGCLRG